MAGNRSAEAEIEKMLGSLGERLRSLRKDRDLTLAELSEQCGLSVSLLSRLETGKRQPTLDVLVPLARSHGISLDRLVGMPQSGDPRFHLQPRRIMGGGVVVPLTRHRSRTQVFKHVLGPREPVLVAHEGHAWLYVLAGRLRLILGAQEHRLEAGESTEFDSTVPHWFGPVGQSVEILHIFSPDGRRLAADDASGLHSR